MSNSKKRASGISRKASRRLKTVRLIQGFIVLIIVVSMLAGIIVAVFNGSSSVPVNTP